MLISVGVHLYLRENEHSVVPSFIFVCTYNSVSENLHILRVPTFTENYGEY